MSPTAQWVLGIVMAVAISAVSALIAWVFATSRNNAAKDAKIETLTATVATLGAQLKESQDSLKKELDRQRERDEKLTEKLSEMSSRLTALGTVCEFRHREDTGKIRLPQTS